jgi:hypothetical protein
VVVEHPGPPYSRGKEILTVPYQPSPVFAAGQPALPAVDPAPSSDDPPPPSYDEVKLGLAVLDVASGPTGATTIPINGTSPAWQETLLVAKTGIAGIKEFFNANRNNPSLRSVGRIVEWCHQNPSEARSIIDEVDAEQAGQEFDLGICGSREFAQKSFPREWLVKGVAVRGRPGIIGGPQKTLKTSTVVDLVVSMAGAVPFLGKFEVTQRTRVLVISGESGEATIQETLRRVCRSKGFEPEDIDGFAYWGFRLPQLDDDEQLGALTQFIDDHGIEVVLIDPLYLCLLTGAGSKRVDPANLFDMGPLLRRITSAILSANATPWLIHHFKKTRSEPFEVPELEDLAFAGIQEFARQWICLGRRERYVPGTGSHKLWLAVGGSDGHSGEWALDVEEGVVGDGFEDRQWNVAVLKTSEVRDQERQTKQAETAERQTAREQARAQAREKQIEVEADRAYGKLCELRQATLTDWRNRLGLSGQKFAPVVDHLLQHNRVHAIGIEVISGKSGTRPIDGFAPGPRPAAICSDGYTGTHRDTPGHTGTNLISPSVDPDTGTPGQDGGSPPVGGSPSSPGVSSGSNGDGAVSTKQDTRTDSVVACARETDGSTTSSTNLADWLTSTLRGRWMSTHWIVELAREQGFRKRSEIKGTLAGRFRSRGSGGSREWTVHDDPEG